MQCNGASVKGNHVVEENLAKDSVTTKARFEKVFSSGPQDFTLKANGYARVSTLFNGNGKDKAYVIESTVKASAAFSPSASLFPQLFVSTDSASSEVCG